MPESGASKVMKSPRQTPAQRPVKRARRGMLDTARTTSISTKVIASSAANATGGPPAPGRVVTKWTEGWARKRPSTSAAAPIPTAPPMNCAAT